jgi:hypothetical protein
MKAGDKITAIVKGELTKLLLLYGGRSNVWTVRAYRERKISGSLYPLKEPWIVDLSPHLEGQTWARGWDGQDAGALRASTALLRSSL